MSEGNTRSAAIAVLVAALLLVVAGIAYFRDLHRSGSESPAISAVRTVLTAQDLYRDQHGRFAPDLAALAHEGLIRGRLVTDGMVRFESYWPGVPKREYKLLVSGAQDGKGFLIEAKPIDPDADPRYFRADQTGVIRFEIGRPATTTSAALAG